MSRRWRDLPPALRQWIEQQKHWKENRCDACDGTAKAPDGKWCLACGATGLQKRAEVAARRE